MFDFCIYLDNCRYIMRLGADKLFAVSVVCRIEKEKNQMKTELDDLRGQIDHLTKAKVCIS